MSPDVDDDVFARLVGSYPQRDTLLFEVSREFLPEADDKEWSDPVRFRFVRREGAFVELEFQRQPTQPATASKQSHSEVQS